VSNAQTLAKGWKSYADPQFGGHWKFLPESDPFLLHEAGQPVPAEIRVPLERLVGECLRRDVIPEAVARILVRAIREDSTKNSAVGPNVMCTFVHRREVKPQASMILGGGAVPIVPNLMNEFAYFARMQNPTPSRFIYSPGSPTDFVDYGPSLSRTTLTRSATKGGPPISTESSLSQRASTPASSRDAAKP
jgi:hypothetical protein